MNNFITCLILAAVFSSCASMNIPNFNYHLIDSNSKSFEDDELRITTAIFRDRINLKIENKTNKTLNLITDKSTFLTMNGKSLRIVPEGTVIAQRSSAQPPVVILSQSKINQNFYASDHSLVGETIVMQGDLMPGFAFDKKDYSGKPFRLFLVFKDNSSSASKEVDLKFLIQK